MKTKKAKISSEFDPAGHERGPLTSGVRVRADHRTHVDRLNGPNPTGGAVIPALVEQAEHEHAHHEHAVHEVQVTKPISVNMTEKAHATDKVDAVVHKAIKKGRSSRD